MLANYEPTHMHAAGKMATTDGPASDSFVSDFICVYLLIRIIPISLLHFQRNGKALSDYIFQRRNRGRKMVRRKLQPFCGTKALTRDVWNMWNAKYMHFSQGKVMQLQFSLEQAELLKLISNTQKLFKWVRWLENSVFGNELKTNLNVTEIRRPLWCRTLWASLTHWPRRVVLCKIESGCAFTSYWLTRGGEWKCCFV